MPTSRSSNPIAAQRDEFEQGDVLWIRSFPFKVVGFYGCGDPGPGGVRSVWVRGEVIPGHGLPAQEVTFRVPINQPLALVVDDAPRQVEPAPPAYQVVDGQPYRLVNAA
jgi:hypothetical protein